MNKFFLQIIADSSRTVLSNSQSITHSNHWFWISVVELIFILFLLYKRRHKKKDSFLNGEEETFKNSKEMAINMSDLMNDIHKSKDLYKKLSVKCHPDRFIDSELNKKADMLFQEITRNQRNYKKLLELKETAQNELNITI